MPVTAEMVLLDLVSDYPATEAVIKRYDVQVGTCICCEMLFEPLREVAAKYSLDLERLLVELNMAARTDL